MNLTFLDWMLDAPREDPERVDTRELEALGPRFQSYFSQQMPVRVDGIVVPPVVRTLQVNNPDESLLPLFPLSGWRGLRKVFFNLAYPLKAPPDEISLAWPAYPPDVLSVLPQKPPLEIAAEWTADGLRSQVLFTRAEPGFTWRRPSGELSARLERVPLPPVAQPWIPVWMTMALMVFVVGFFAGFAAVLMLGRRLMLSAQRAALLVGLLGAVVVILVRPSRPAILALGSRATTGLDEREACEIFEKLQANLYRAFDYEAESTVYDCNANDIIDSCEIAAGTAVDSDGTGIPDECEDCNQNGRLDSLDIALGESADCQKDRIPDECQLPGADCNGNGVPDACEVESGAAADCNANGTPDGCDLASGTSVDTDATGIPDECEDCNANGFLDTVDISAGISQDCNVDRIPDECQLGDPAYAVEYLIEDGTRDGNYGFGSIAEVLWMNRFTVEPGAEWIGEIRVVLGNVVANEPYQVALWSDPNNDGNPTDAQLLVTANARAANGNTSIFNEIRIDPTYIGAPGTSFFAGVLYSDRYGNQFPVGVDTSTFSQQSWVAAGPEVDPNNLSAAAVFGYLTQATALVRAMGFDGALPFDCNASGVPDACEIESGLLDDADQDGIPDCCESGTNCKGCATDLDGDGQIGASDLSLVLANRGSAAGDVNGDGTTDAADLSDVLATWGVCK